MSNIFLILIVLMLIKMSYVDYKKLVVYDLDILITAILVIAYKSTTSSIFSANSLYGLVFNALFYTTLFFVVRWYYSEEQYGQGDVLCNIVLGYLLGFPAVLYLLIYSSILMLLYCLPLLCIKRLQALKQPIPLIPFYSLASVFLL